MDYSSIHIRASVRPSVTNTISYKLLHANVLKFYEWPYHQKLTFFLVRVVLFLELCNFEKIIMNMSAIFKLGTPNFVSLLEITSKCIEKLLNEFL